MRHSPVPFPDKWAKAGRRRIANPSATAEPLKFSTDIWVAALIRRAELGGGHAVVVHKGDARAGSVLVKTLNRSDGRVRLFAEATRADGETVWMRPSLTEKESEIDAYIGKARRIDADLWVVEVEDRQGRHFLTEDVEED